MQLSTLRYYKGTSDLFKLTYNYGTTNNGQIRTIDDVYDNSRDMTYTYDEWSRLKTATAGTSPVNWSLGWDYDRYGNRKNQNVLQGWGPAPQLAISPTTNRITSAGYSYDASGNMTKDAINCYTYNAESRLTQVKDLSCTTVQATYLYGPSGLRWRKTVGGTTTHSVYAGSRVIAEYTNNYSLGSPTKEYIYAGSQLLATIQGGAPTYHHPDHLSTRMNTDANGNVSRWYAHFPFGETWFEFGPADKWKFTSYERDSESALDYATFRFHSPRLGRFMTPDPACADKFTPQMLNLYAYVVNDPTNRTDPLGQFPVQSFPMIDPILHESFFYLSGSPWGLPLGGPSLGGGPVGALIGGFGSPTGRDVLPGDRPECVLCDFQCQAILKAERTNCSVLFRLKRASYVATKAIELWITARKPDSFAGPDQFEDYDKEGCLERADASFWGCLTDCNNKWGCKFGVFPN